MPASKLGSGRGGPRCLCCVIVREPAVQPAPVLDTPPLRVLAGRGLPPMPRPVPAVSDPRGLPVGDPQLVRPSDYVVGGWPTTSARMLNVGHGQRHMQLRQRRTGLAGSVLMPPASSG